MSEPPFFRVLTEIGIIAQLSRTALERATPDGVSAAGFGVLNHLARLEGDWTPARLARAFEVTKGAMTNTLQRLEAEGLVRMAPDERDGRVKQVTITAKGRRVREATIERLGPAMAALHAQLPRGLVGDLLPLLNTLRATMDSGRD
jgi:DNA-binding MarR family transcriptional regulator